MKLTDKQKKQLRKEVEKETCPRVLVFERKLKRKRIKIKPLRKS